MDIGASFDRLLKRLSLRGSLTDKATVYFEGVRGKLKQVDYALTRIQNLETVGTFRTATHDTGSLLSDASRDIDDQIAFYSLGNSGAVGRRSYFGFLTGGHRLKMNISRGDGEANCHAGLPTPCLGKF